MSNADLVIRALGKLLEMFLKNLGLGFVFGIGFFTVFFTLLYGGAFIAMILGV